MEQLIKQDDIQSLPKDWEIKRLKEVCEINPAKKEARDKLKNTDLVTFLPMEDLGFEPKSIAGIKEKQLNDVVGSYTYFAENDILLAKITPCFENGKIGIAQNLINGMGFGSSEYIVFRSKGEVNVNYLCYFLSRSMFREEGALLMSGAVGHKRVSKDWIENYPLPFPKSFPEQLRIVSLLDQTFAALAKAKENAQRNLQNAKEVFESYLQGVFTAKNDNWEVKYLQELGIITSSKRIYKSEYVKDGVPFYRTKEIKELSNGKDITLELFISRERYNEIKKSFGVPQINDLLMSAVGTIGEIMVVENDDEFYFKDGNIVWFKEFKNLDTNYLKFALSAFVENIKSLAIGSAYSALTIEKLNTYKISYPKSKTKQQTIVANLDALSAETKRLEAIYQQKLINLEELKKSVLQKAFNGDLITNKK